MDTPDELLRMEAALVEGTAGSYLGARGTRHPQSLLAAKLAVKLYFKFPFTTLKTKHA